jgi:hypothetical protein
MEKTTKNILVWIVIFLLPILIALYTQSFFQTIFKLSYIGQFLFFLIALGPSIILIINQVKKTSTRVWGISLFLIFMVNIIAFLDLLSSCLQGRCL